MAFFFPLLLPVATVVVITVLTLTVVDFGMLFIGRGGVQANRLIPARLSLGDENAVVLSLVNTFSFRTKLTIIDEQPEQFQERHFNKQASIAPRGRTSINYTLRPTARGEYSFGFVLCYVTTLLGFVQRRFKSGEESTTKVLSFLSAPAQVPVNGYEREHGLWGEESAEVGP